MYKVQNGGNNRVELYKNNTITLYYYHHYGLYTIGIYIAKENQENIQINREVLKLTPEKQVVLYFQRTKYVYKKRFCQTIL